MKRLISLILAVVLIIAVPISIMGESYGDLFAYPEDGYESEGCLDYGYEKELNDYQDKDYPNYSNIDDYFNYDYEEEPSRDIFVYNENIISAANSQIESLIVSVTPNNYIQTYFDPTINLYPGELSVQIGIVLHDSYVSGGRIELPLDFLSPTTFDVGYQGLPFFVARNDYDFSTEPMVAGWRIETSPSYDTLIIDLVDGAGSSQTFNLVIPFDFNPFFLSKVPANTIMWDIQASVYIDSDLAQTGTFTLVGGGSSNFGVGGELNIPNNPNFFAGGNVVINHNFSHNNSFRSTYDHSFPNRYFIDVPVGTVLIGALATWFNQSEPIDINGVPYTRHYRVITDVLSDSWVSVWATHRTAHFMNASITPPATAPGDQFRVRRGFEVRMVNHPPTLITQTFTYTRIDRPLFDLRFHSLHQQIGVTNITNNAVSPTPGTVGHETFISVNSTRNLGADPARNVVFELYHHESNPSSHRINFSTITLLARRDADTTPWTNWHTEFEIVNATNGAIRTVDGGIWMPPDVGISQNRMFSATFIAGLTTPGEYISRVLVTAMGDGTQEGYFLPMNSLGINYTVRAWNDQMFPDGTPVTNPYRVAMAWRLHHDNADGLPQIRQGATMFSRHGTLIAANARLMADGESTVAVGSTVHYTLLGFNQWGYRSSEANTSWTDPRIIVQVPHILTVQSIGDAVDFSGVSHPATFTRVSSDASWNYYEFTVPGYIAPVRSGTNPAITNPTFSIPIAFSVDENAPAGTFNFGNVLLTQIDSEDFIRPPERPEIITKTAAVAEAPFGLSLGEPFFQSNQPAPPELVILPNIDISADVSASSVQTNNEFVPAAGLFVPAAQGEEVVMRLTLHNRGNVATTDLRLYNILPHVGDLHGSTGDIEFVNVYVGGNGSTVRFADSSMSIPSYAGLDLQTHNFNSWSTTPGTDVRAFFVDFGALTLYPGQSVDIDLTLRIPAGADQTAFNQFLYSFNAGSDLRPNLTSAVAGFSTEAIAIRYNQNLPTGVTETPDNWPEDNTAIRGVNGGGAEGTNFDILRVTSDIPTLTNYIFAGWFANPAGTGTAYAANSQQSFAARQTLILYATWTGAPRTVTFEAGTHGTFDGTGAEQTTRTASVPHGATIAATSTASVPSATSTNTNYEFAGWRHAGLAAADDNLTTAEVEALPITAAITFTAQWRLINRTVTFEAGTHGTFGGTGAEQTTRTTSVPHGATIAATSTASVPSVTSTNTNYEFAGWRHAGLAVTDENLTTAEVEALPITAAITFTAQWRLVGRTVTFEAGTHGTFGGTGAEQTTRTASVPHGATIAATSTASVPSATSTNTNYEFAGWRHAGLAVTDDNLTTAEVEALPITAAITFTAQWRLITTATPHTVTFLPGAATGVTNMPANRNVPNGDTIVSAGAVADPQRTGFTFAGWTQTTPAGATGITSANVGVINVTQAMTFTAQWTPNNGGTPTSNLVSTKSANVPNNSHVIVGQTITYTIRVQNTGSASSGSVTIQDIIPTGMTLVADTATYTPTISGNTLIWSIPSIAAGQTVEVSFQVTINQLPNNIFERTFRNTATVNGNNTNTVELITRRLVKNPDRMTVNVGETINWTLSGFHNPTDRAVANFAIIDMPGLGLNFQSASIPAFAGGAGLTYEIRYRVAGSSQWQTHATGISANAPHNFSLPQPGDIHYTEIGLFFGTVPAGFGLGNDIVFTFVVADNAPNNTLVNRFLIMYDNIETEGSSPDRPTVGTPGTGQQVSPPTPTIPFNPTHHAYMIGDNYGNVRPNASITRAEVATIFFRLVTDDYRTQMWTQTNPFPDVQLNNWFNNAVSTMANAGVIVGMPDGSFQPQRAITRAEFAVAMTRFFEGLPTEGTNMFPDIADHWAAAEINAAARLGWVTGMPNGNFEPNRPITRAEAAALINRILGRLPRTANDLLPGMVTWADNANTNAWYYLHIQEATNSNEFVMQADGIHKTWTALLNPRDWQVLERPNSRPQDIIGQYRPLNKVQLKAV